MPTSIGHQSNITMPSRLVNFAVRHGLYPLLAVATATYIVFELSQAKASLGGHYAIYLATTIAAMMIVEARFAMRADWRMTWRTFSRRDVPYLALGAATIGLSNWAAGHVAASHAMTPSNALAQLSIWLGVPAVLLVQDLLWYWLHRLSHEARGPLGRFLWRMHAAHHLPQQVYVSMHAVGHPINTVAVRAIVAIPAYFLGFSPEAVFAASVITAFQGLVSHFNVDIRAGWLNRVLVGTEVHRYHHSTDVREAKNFGAVTSVWDQLFGTFVYRPRQAPAALGVDDPKRYPADHDMMSMLAFPLRSTHREAHGGCTDR